MRCGTCKHYKDGNPWGVCQKDPPVVITTGRVPDWQQPKVADDCLCSHFFDTNTMLIVEDTENDPDMDNKEIEADVKKTTVKPKPKTARKKS